MAFFNVSEMKKMKQLDSEIVRKYREAAMEIESSPWLHDFPADIHIYRLPPFNFKCVTFPVYYRNAYLLIKSSFDESELQDRGLLAHELGHSFHSLYQNKKFLIPLNVFLLLLFLLLFSMLSNNWGPFFLVLFASLYLLYNGLFRYESNVETEADLRALKIVEKCEGGDNMHITAANLMRIRIRECIIKRSKPEYIHSIFGLSFFVPFSERYRLLNDTLRDINKHCINKKEKKRLVKFEKKLRRILEQNDYYESALSVQYYPVILYYCCVTVVVLGTVVAVLMSGDTSFQNVFINSYAVSYVSLIILLVINLIQNYLKKRLWKKTNYYLSQIGN